VTDLFEITVQQVTVFVQKSVHVVSHWTGIMYEAELLTHIGACALPDFFYYINRVLFKDTY